MAKQQRETARNEPMMLSSLVLTFLPVFQAITLVQADEKLRRLPYPQLNLRVVHPRRIVRAAAR
jgi:hypothetical protein